jgi:membrane protein
MLWVYYSAVILYFGAVFSKCYAVKFAQPIVASPFAEIVQTVKVGSDIPTIQKAQQKKNTIKKIAK